MRVIKLAGIVSIFILIATIAILYILPVKNSKKSIPTHLLFAHRAISPYFPENSLESMEYLAKQGVKGIEIDVRKTLDHQWVLFHDPDGFRMLGIDDEIQNLKFADWSKHGLIFSGNQTESSIPLLETVFQKFSDSIILYLDIKETSFLNAREIVRLIKLYKLERSIIIASTNAVFILYIKLVYPEMLVALEGFNAGKELLYSLLPGFLLPDYLSSFHYKTNISHVNWLKERSLLDLKIVYDVDTSSMEKVKSMGFTNIIADYDSIMFMNFSK